MLTQQQLWMRRIISVMLLTATFALSPLNASAQNQDQPSLFWDVTKKVLFDPTTYAPALVGYDSTMRDWNSSQPFFRNGFLEHNQRFTISGRPDDFALSYSAGRRRILSDAFANLQMSVVNNAADGVIEHLLIARYPNHRKLVRTLGWIERISFASYMSYRLSAAHYRQWQANEQMARQLGYR